MSNLDNLVAKIIKDGEERAKTITNEAEEKAKEIVAKKLAEAEKEKTAIAADAKIQAENAKEKNHLSHKIESTRRYAYGKAGGDRECMRRSAETVK